MHAPHYIRWRPETWLGLGLGFGLCVVGALSLRGGSWPEYRGPNHNGISRETILTDWVQHPPERLWRKPLGAALSSLVIAEGRVFTQVRRPLGQEEQEFCVALDADSGEELWATPLGPADYPNGGVGSDDGPRSTPAVRDGRVFVFSSYLRLVCLAADTGALRWDIDFVKKFGSRVIPWQNAASPLLYGDLILVNSNAKPAALLAVRQEDGVVVWQLHNERMTQASPVTASWAGVPQVIFFTQSGLVSVAPETGGLLWRYPFPYSVATAASPVVADELVYCSAAYGKGAGAARIQHPGDTWAATPVWRKPGEHMNHWSTPVYHEGHLYGIYGQSSVKLQCIEAATGTRKWSRSGPGRGGILKVGEHLLLLTEAGEVVLIQPDPAKYHELARFRAVTGKCWNVPAISNGRLYVRSTREAACYRLATPELPALALQPSLRPGDQGVRVALRTVDASPLDADRAARIRLLSTTNALSPPDEWTLWPDAGIWENGALWWDDPGSASIPQRYFQTREEP